MGLIDDERWESFIRRRDSVDAEKARLEKVILPPTEEVNAYLREHGSTEISTGIRMSELLRRPELDYRSLAALDPERPPLDRRTELTVEVDVKYEGYIRRQLAEVERTAKLENRRLPEELDYTVIKGLRLEAIEKLSAVRPLSVGQASRISGVSPADISVLLIYLKG